MNVRSGGTYQGPFKRVLLRYNLPFKPQGDAILPTNGMPTLITTRLKASIENGPVDTKETEEDLFGRASDCEWIGDGGGGHHPHGAASAQQGGWKRNNLARWEHIYVLYQVRTVRTLLPPSVARTCLISGLEVSAEPLDIRAFNVDLRVVWARLLLGSGTISSRKFPRLHQPDHHSLGETRATSH